MIGKDEQTNRERLTETKDGEKRSRERESRREQTRKRSNATRASKKSDEVKN